MPLTRYSYRAIDSQGRIVKGEMNALNELALAAALKTVSLELISARPQRSKQRSASRRLSRREMIDLFYYLEVLLRAGVPAIDALRDLGDTSDSHLLRQVAQGMAESIENGSSFSDALLQQPAAAQGVIPKLIRAGEESGQLVAVLGEIVAALKWADEVVAAAKKAVIYPAFALTVITGVIVFLMSYLVPQLIPFIKEMGGELPAHTRALIAVSDFVKDYWWLLLPAPFVITATLSLLARMSRPFRKKLHQLVLRVPVFGPIIEKIVLSQVVNTLAMMYRSGIPLLDAILRAAESAGNLHIGDGLRDAHDRVATGTSISQAFAQTRIFPPLVVRMLRVGENSGQIDEALLNAKYFYQRDINETVGKLQTMIEPVLIVVLGLMLGWIMLAVLGPIYDTISQIKA